MTDNGNSDKFLGMTKAQFLAAILGVLMGVLAIQAAALVQQHRLADQGSQAHDSLCVFKSDLEKRVDDSRKFLALTKQERVLKYGPSFGTIPDATIRSSLHNQEATVASLGRLHC